MKKARHFLALIVCTSVFWYLVISFVNWNIVWVENIPNMEIIDRFAMFIFIVFKIVLDAAIWDLGLRKALQKESKT